MNVLGKNTCEASSFSISSYLSRASYTFEIAANSIVREPSNGGRFSACSTPRIKNLNPGIAVRPPSWPRTSSTSASGTNLPCAAKKAFICRGNIPPWWSFSICLRAPRKATFSSTGEKFMIFPRDAPAWLATVRFWPFGTFLLENQGQPCMLEFLPPIPPYKHPRIE